ncbi:MAG: hypothetical protein ABI898_01645 [Sphingomonadales bacterium]
MSATSPPSFLLFCPIDSPCGKSACVEPGNAAGYPALSALYARIYFPAQERPNYCPLRSVARADAIMARASACLTRACASQIVALLDSAWHFPAFGAVWTTGRINKVALPGDETNSCVRAEDWAIAKTGKHRIAAGTRIFTSKVILRPSMVGEMEMNCFAIRARL